MGGHCILVTGAGTRPSYCVDSLDSNDTEPSTVILAEWEEEFQKLFCMLLDTL